MSLLHYDGFDHYSNAQRTTSGQFTGVFAPTGAEAITASVGRGGTAGYKVTPDRPDYTNGGSKTVAPGDTKSIVGALVYSNIVPTGYASGLFSVTEGGTPQVSVVLNTDGTLSVTRGGNYNRAATLGTTSYALSAAAFYFVELKVVIHASAGTVDLRVNGVSRLSLTGLNTRNTANTSWNGVFLGNMGANSWPFNNLSNYVVYDDWYICDGTTQSGPNAFNDFLGPVYAQTVQPTADGNYTAFTPSTGSSHFALVDENPPTDDTDYNTGAAIGDRDSYQYTLPTVASGGILATQLAVYAKKDDAGTRKIVDFARVSSTDYDGSVEQALGTSYQFSPFIRTENPATSAEWTPGATVELGIKVSS